MRRYLGTIIEAVVLAVLLFVAWEDGRITGKVEAYTNINRDINHRS